MLPEVANIGGGLDKKIGAWFLSARKNFMPDTSDLGQLRISPTRRSGSPKGTTVPGLQA